MIWLTRTRRPFTRCDAEPSFVDAVGTSERPSLSEFGQEFAARPRGDHYSSVPTPDPALVERIVASTGLTSAEATRVVEDVIAFHAEPVEEYVRRRHAYLKTSGAKNDEIFARIADELAGRVVAAPGLSPRQLRRIVYG